MKHHKATNSATADDQDGAVLHHSGAIDQAVPILYGGAGDIHPITRPIIQVPVSAPLPTDTTIHGIPNAIHPIGLPVDTTIHGIPNAIHPIGLPVDTTIHGIPDAIHPITQISDVNTAPILEHISSLDHAIQNFLAATPAPVAGSVPAATYVPAQICLVCPTPVMQDTHHVTADGAVVAHKA